ncbi:MAG TPA: hypothetical protein VNA24_03440 [Hyalangium sp.]|nr:hypothetical protein [Hyalangium sp.]
MTTQKPEAPQQARTPRGSKQPPSPAMCKTLAFFAAVAAGCTGVPIRPEPFECPERVQKIMYEQLGWEGDYRFVIALDDRFEEFAKNVVFRPGAEVVGFALNERSPDELGRKKPLIPPGTKFWGRVYVDPQDEDAKERGHPAKLWVKYERAKVPGQDEVPVCVVAASNRVYTVDKDGFATAYNHAIGRTIITYPAPGAAW